MHIFNYTDKKKTIIIKSTYKKKLQNITTNCCLIKNNCQQKKNHYPRNSMIWFSCISRSSSKSFTCFQSPTSFTFQSFFIFQKSNKLLGFFSDIYTLIFTVFKILKISQCLNCKEIFSTLLCYLESKNDLFIALKPIITHCKNFNKDTDRK